MEKKKYLPIHLSDDEKNGFTPLADIGAIQRDAAGGPAPKATPICRMALRAIAGNIDLFKKAREVGMSGNYEEIIKNSLTQSIRMAVFAQKKKNETQAA